MIATIQSASLLGARGRPVTVEVHVSTGLPAFNVVGLPDEACRESRDRVRAALLSSGLPWPQQRITVNLAPSSVRKGGAGLDLPIAVALLVAQGVLPVEAVEGHGFIGELGLDGSIRRVPGVVPLVAALGKLVAVVPLEAVREAALVARGAAGADRLATVVAALRDGEPWPSPAPPPEEPEQARSPDLADVRGQATGRMALEVAAAGGHHLLLIGPPGSGKSMLAHRLPGLLPPLPSDEALEVTTSHSAAGVALSGSGLVATPPFRAPHHTASLVAMVGGGTASLRPGEVSLAHCGILFLDEVAEFPSAVLDGLREPLEEGVVRVTRARAAVEFPARFLLVAAMNACPCGSSGRPGAGCSCGEPARARYLRRVSGPLLDRFDLRLEVSRPQIDDLLAGRSGESSAVVAQRVALARERAAARGFPSNGALPAHVLDEVAPISSAAQRLLRRELELGRLTGRGLHRIRRVARTLADLVGADEVIDESYVHLALTLRIDPMDLARAAA